jgi:hypothetical protein
VTPRGGNPVGQFGLDNELIAADDDLNGAGKVVRRDRLGAFSASTAQRPREFSSPWALVATGTIDFRHTKRSDSCEPKCSVSRGG